MVNQNIELDKIDLPEWLQDFSERDKIRYIHSNNCKICNLEVGGHRIRHEIETLIIEGKKLVEISAMMEQKYSLDVSPANISLHMKRHAPDYINVIKKYMRENLDDLLSKPIKNEVDSVRVFKTAMQIGFRNMTLNPSSVGPKETLTAAKHCHDVTEGINVNITSINQEELSRMIEVMQRIMTVEQKELFAELYLGESQIAIEGGEIEEMEVEQIEEGQFEEIAEGELPTNIPFADEEEIMDD